MARSAASSSMWMMGLSIGEKVFSFGIYIVLARLLDIVEFGIVAFCVLFLDFLTMLISSGTREYIVTRKEAPKLLLNTCLVCLIVGSLVVVGVFSQLFTFFVPDDSSPLLTDVFQVLLFLPLIASFNTVQFAVLQRKFQFKEIAIRSMISTILSGSISLWFAFNGYGVWALVMYKYLLVIIDSVILLYLTRLFPSLQFSVEIFKDCYRFSIPLILSEVFTFWSSRIMELFVSVFFGPASFALLDVARKFAKLIQQVSLTALRPVCLSHIAKADASEKGTAFSQFSSYVSIIVAPVLVCLGIYADAYVLLVFGEQWQPAIPIIQILSFTAAAQCISWYFSLLLIANGKTKQVFTLNVSFFAASLLAGVLSYKLSFEQYITVQVTMINLIAFGKYVYLLKSGQITVSNIKKYVIPVFVSLLFFILIAMLSKIFIFEYLKLNNIFDLLIVAVLCGISMGIYLAFCFMIFRTFSKGIVSALRPAKKVM